MDQSQFQKLLEQMGDLDPTQFKALVQAYAGKTGQSESRVWDGAVYASSEQHLATLGVNRACPGCGSVAVVHNGTNPAGIQRLKCQDCGTTFTRFTGTILEKSRFPWEVWAAVLRMTLDDDSLEDIQTVLERDYDCAGINIKTIFHMRLKLLYAMAAIPQPTLTGVIQMDETFLRESQKGHNLELVSYLKGEKRRPRYGRDPSKYGTTGPEFATILTAIDSRGLCVCKAVALGRMPQDAVVDLCDAHFHEPVFICTDANPVYPDVFRLMEMPHYIKPSNFLEVLKHNGYENLPDDYELVLDDNDPERARNEAIRTRYKRQVYERLYREGQVDYIANRGDLSFGAFLSLKEQYGLNLARVNGLHNELKFTLERQMTNVATKYLPLYLAFFSYRHNWKVANGEAPISKEAANAILDELVSLKVNLTRAQLDGVTLDLPKPSGRYIQLLKEQTAKARQITQNKYFKFDEEDLPCFNKRRILLDAPKSKLVELAKSRKLKGYTKMSQWGLAAALIKDPDIDEIIMDLITKDRHYEIADEDLKRLQDLRYLGTD